MEASESAINFDIKSCPVSLTVAMIGGKWKMVIIYSIFGGTNRFGSMLRAIPDISKKMLANELKELEMHGLISRKVFPEVPPRVEYSLTEKGMGLEKIAEAMRAYGSRWLLTDQET